MEDITRVMQGIVSGIGFLGAGAIIKMEKGARVEGLTTAAGIWLTSAVGMAAGMGMEIVAVITTLVALAVVGMIPRIVGPHDATAPRPCRSSYSCDPGQRRSLAQFAAQPRSPGRKPWSQL